MGSKIRTLAEFSDTETRAVLWTDRVEGSVEDLFALQERLSQRIVTTIAPHVRQTGSGRVLAKRPESLEAYDAVLRGLDLLHRLRRADFEQAPAMFLRAIELDGAWATPYALAAFWHSIRIGQSWSDDRRRDYDHVNRLATLALERDPFDARALALCGHVRAFLFRDYDGAFGLLKRAIAASPSSFEAWLRSSPAFSYVGEGAEARLRAQRALRLSPFDPQLFYAQTAVALACYTSGRFDEAAAWGRKATAHNPRYTPALRIRTASLSAAGRIDEAADVARALLELEPAFRVHPFVRDYAYRDGERLAALAEHLRAAGLPA